MFDYDPYTNERQRLPDLHNCYQSAIRIAQEHGLRVIYWVEEEAHYYVVVPDLLYALGERYDKPRLTSDYVLINGIAVELTEVDLKIWGQENN